MDLYKFKIEENVNNNKIKKAEIIRWNCLKKLDWEKDKYLINDIFKCSNPRFFVDYFTDSNIEDKVNKIISHLNSRISSPFFGEDL